MSSGAFDDLPRGCLRPNGWGVDTVRDSKCAQCMVPVGQHHKMSCSFGGETDWAVKAVEEWRERQRWIGLITDEELDRVERNARGAQETGEIVFPVHCRAALALVATFRELQAKATELDARIDGLTTERDHYRKALANVQAENERLHKSLASLGWRYAECGKDGYQCGLCVTCGGYEAKPPVVVVQVSK